MTLSASSLLSVCSLF